jgi:hypothetical protein
MRLRMISTKPSSHDMNDRVYDLDVIYADEPAPGWYGRGLISIGPFRTQEGAATACRDVVWFIGASEDVGI